MDKVAMVKQAEVTGVIAGLVDAEYIKLASAEDFDTVCEVVANNISDKDWTFDEVVEKTAEVMDEVYKIYEENGSIKKEANEKELSESEIMAEIGALTLAKEAGDVSEDEAESKMSKLKKMLKEHKGSVAGGVAGLTALGLLAHPKSRDYILRRASAGNEFKSGLRDDVKSLASKGMFKAEKGIKSLKDSLADRFTNPPSAASGFKRTLKMGK